MDLAPYLQALPASTELSPGTFLDQVFTAIQALGGLPALLKISTVLTLVIASMKVSFLKRRVWNKLGWAQVWLAPSLGLVAGILGLGAGSVPVTPALVFAYVVSGSGAVFLHEILDSLKALPGVGPVFLGVITLLERMLGGGVVERPRSVVK